MQTFNFKSVVLILQELYSRTYSSYRWRKWKTRHLQWSTATKGSFTFCYL